MVTSTRITSATGCSGQLPLWPLPWIPVGFFVIGSLLILNGTASGDAFLFFIVPFVFLIAAPVVVLIRRRSWWLLTIRLLVVVGLLSVWSAPVMALLREGSLGEFMY